MNRIDRLHAILVQLQSKKVVKAHEIADRFGISLRTVYRDIRSLEEGGVPIGAEAGTGYFLDESFALPPVMFTDSEANALLIAGKLTEQFTDQLVNHDFQSALYKIKAVLTSGKKEKVETLDQSVMVMSGLNLHDSLPSIFLSEVQKALTEQKIVKLNYKAAYNNTESERLVEPIGLLMYAMKWHLIGFCRLRHEYRDFRLDRIQKIAVTPERFTRNREKAFEEYIALQKERNKLFEIKLVVTPDLANYIAESKFWYGFVSQCPEGDGVAMQFLNPDLEGFARWVITMGNHVAILHPPQLAHETKELAKVLAKHYLT